jgi:hypothetical protein
VGRQYVRIKSLLGYAHRLCYLPLNAATISQIRWTEPEAALTKRIISGVEMALLIRGALTESAIASDHQRRSG